jgi:dihydrofolate synthase/folylpolyglutamate synthase
MRIHPLTATRSKHTKFATTLQPKTLDEWLVFQQALHRVPIELGLERVRRVAQRLGLYQPPCPLITVAGTNGKGSCVAFLESILCEAGYRVGCYTSPHLLRYNERVRIIQRTVSDEELCVAFERVEAARAEISLSYFEFGTLAAFSIFCRHELDAVILEVGLGGRLDAVNIWDADLAVIASIGLDHTDWLGTDREAIGFEKAGIMRVDKPVVCGDSDPPKSVATQAAKLRAPLFNMGTDYGYVRNKYTWQWYGPDGGWSELPLPALVGEVQLANAATILMGLSLLRNRLKVGLTAVTDGLRKAVLAGRFQRIPGTVETVLDIAHNPDAARSLAHNLQEYPSAKRTHAVFALLADKDAIGIVEPLQYCVDRWYLSQVESARALPVYDLQRIVKTRLGLSRIGCQDNVKGAYKQACVEASHGDRVLVFGSVYTVAPILALYEATPKNNVP